MNEKNVMPGSCPHCRSTNLSVEPVYPEDPQEDEYGVYDYDDEELEDKVALYCVTCGHFIGEYSSQLRGSFNLINKDIL